MNYWRETLNAAQAFRRELHAHPELSWQETRTAAKVREALTDLSIPWRPCAGTGTVAWLQPKGTGRHIALRGDIDALPINEKTDKAWASQEHGCMHACGHDGHTATLLATARWLKHCESALPGPVTLVFQPAEEGGHGAREMIADGALEGVDEIYGWHNWPAIPFGKLVCPDDLVMCGNGTFTLTIKGKGGHASQPEQCRDPVLAASAITLALQQIVSRHLAPQTAAVISVTSINAPSAPTVIPETAVIGGSFRVPNEVVRDQVTHLINDISQNTARSYGVECDVSIDRRYSATHNHPRQAQTLREQWHLDHGEAGVDRHLLQPVMASEDFSYFLQAIPGAFALIGGGDSEHAHQVPCHSPHYDFNDDLIPLVTRLFVRLTGAPLPENHP